MQSGAQARERRPPVGTGRRRRAAGKDPEFGGGSPLGRDPGVQRHPDGCVVHAFRCAVAQRCRSEAPTGRTGRRSEATVPGDNDAVTFFPTRARGQNFLHDRSVAERFVAAALGPGEPGNIVEIGSGKGALTFPLLAAGARVLAIEVDPRLAGRVEEYAKERGVAENLRVVTGDALQLDLGAAIADFGAAPPLPMCGNLPFSVASPLLLRLIEGHAAPGAPPLFDTLTLTLQKEVGDRVVARCGGRDYSALSVVVQQALRAEVVFRIHPGAFRPRPRVVSSVIRLVPRLDPPPVGRESHFRLLVRGLFTHRRKTLRNGVARLRDQELAGRVQGALETLGIDAGLRPEQLAVSDFAELSRLTS